ncbi:MAG: hypothetical protein PVH21_05590 [Myxococcales bacterium]
MYSVFLVFTLGAMALTLALTHDMVGLDLARAGEYYAGEAPTVEEQDEQVEGGPALVLPSDGETLAAFEPMSRRKLLEITHFHLFSMPVYLLILSHMYMLSRARKKVKAAWIALATAGTALHIAAPWLVAHGTSAAVPIYAGSGLALLLSYGWMSAAPLWEMWRPR